MEQCLICGGDCLTAQAKKYLNAVVIHILRLLAVAYSTMPSCLVPSHCPTIFKAARVLSRRLLPPTLQVYKSGFYPLRVAREWV